MKVFCAAPLFCLLLPAMAAAQQRNGSDQTRVMQTESPSTDQQSQKEKTDDMQNMPGMDQKQMPGMQMDENSLMNMHPENFLQEIVHHGTSGTSAEPNSTPTPMLMTKKGPWMLMFHANVFITDLQQSSGRRGDKLFSLSLTAICSNPPCASTPEITLGRESKMLIAQTS